MNKVREIKSRISTYITYNAYQWTYISEIYFLLKVHFVHINIVHIKVNINIKTISGLLGLQISHEIILVSIPLYRTLNSKSKYKCLHVYYQKEIKLSLSELFKILSIVCIMKIQHTACK